MFFPGPVFPEKKIRQKIQICIRPSSSFLLLCSPRNLAPTQIPQQHRSFDSHYYPSPPPPPPLPFLRYFLNVCDNVFSVPPECEVLANAVESPAYQVWHISYCILVIAY